ncbi:putative Anti-sigma factor antagonist [Candidatus Magnetomoraceae bacterium gMMP-15]
MNLETRIQDNVLIIDIAGRLDTTTSPEMEKQLSVIVSEDKIKKYNTLILNMKQLKYISSAGLRVIVALAKIVNKYKISFMIAEMNQNIFNVFEISGLCMMFKIFKSEQEAFQQLQK